MRRTLLQRSVAVSAAVAATFALAACQPAATPDPPANPPADAPPGEAATSVPGSPASPATDTGASEIRGTATYRERMRMPPGTALTVQLIDSRLADTPAAVVAERRFDDASGPPYAFVLPFDPAKLRPGGDYGLHASLRAPDGRLAFVTDTRVAVTPGSAAQVELLLRRVASSDAAPAARPSPWDAAKARGVAFRAIGQEPGWLVEVGRGDAPSLHAELDYGERIVDVARVTPQGDRYTGRTADGMDVALLIERTACSDGMSGEAFPATVTLTFGGRQYRGCGRFLDP
jgi:uncharacterized lipoprotein YbaY